jgi:hypothetical protein
MVTVSQLMMKIHPFWPWQKNPKRCLICGRRKISLRHMRRQA